ncbi:MAG: zinc metallopeptidase [Clostridium sp.]|nr:zinc metallopeptidase [Clostridium sp.]
MKYKGRDKSSNIEDRRGKGAAKMMGGVSGLGIIILIVYTLLGGNPGDILGNNNITGGNIAPEVQSSQPYKETEEEKELRELISVVLKDTEDIWNEEFERIGYEYREPTLVIYTDSVSSACGTQSSAVGPFYCPGDEKVYIDLDFYNELSKKFKAPGDFAMAYVVAHEVGHHVQKLLGVTDQVNKIRNQVSEKEFNKYSVRLELQADYLAGVYASKAKSMGVLDKGDLEEALNAASQIGDDTIQKRSMGHTVPDSFTHGTSEQRQRWFYKGFQTGNLDNWDTFSADDL